MGTKIYKTNPNDALSKVSKLYEGPNINLKLDHFDQVISDTDLIIDGKAGKATISYLISKLSDQKEMKPSGKIVFTKPFNHLVTEEDVKNLAKQTGRTVTYLPHNTDLDRADPVHNEIFLEMTGIKFLEAIPDLSNNSVRIETGEVSVNFSTNRNSEEENSKVSSEKREEMREETASVNAKEKDLESIDEAKSAAKVKEIAHQLGVTAGLSKLANELKLEQPAAAAAAEEEGRRRRKKGLRKLF